MLGNTGRRPDAYGTTHINANNNINSSRSTKIWLMGDSTSDSYSNMIRNYIYQSEQNENKLNLISMVSNDIQNVTINGLS